MKFTKDNARIVYMGTPEIAKTVLQGLVEEGFHLVGAITNPDRPLGRKQILTPSPVKAYALSQGIPVFQPVKIREDYGFLEELKPDVIVTMAYGQIVPKAVLDYPTRGCINLHGSLLPSLRGAAPIQRAIELGLDKTGVTLMEMVEAMDAGRMYDKEEIRIEEDDYGSLSAKMGEAGKRLILRDLLPYLNDELPGEIQDESLVTIAKKIKPEEEVLDPSLDAISFLRRLRSLSPTPGGYVYLDGKKFKLLKATLEDSASSIPGTLRFDKKGVHFSCLDKEILLLEVQMEGKKAMDGKSFANGNQHLQGSVASK